MPIDPSTIRWNAPAPASTGGFVPLGPRVPKQPPAQTPAQASSDVLGNELKALQIEEARQKAAEARAKMEAQARAIPETAHELLNVIDTAFEANKVARQGNFAVGLGSDTMKGWGGTSARALKGKLATIAANTAFSRLQKMRDESPTGGALGAISERELELLQSTIASLDQGLPSDEFQGNMRKVMSAYSRVLRKLPGGRDVLGRWQAQKKSEIEALRSGKPAQTSGDVDAILQKYGVK